MILRNRGPTIKFEFVCNGDGNLIGCYSDNDGLAFCDDCIFGNCEPDDDKMWSLLDVINRVMTRGENNG